MTRDDYNRLLGAAKTLVAADSEAHRKFGGEVGFMHREPYAAVGEYFLPTDVVHRIWDLKEAIEDV